MCKYTASFLLSLAFVATSCFAEKQVPIKFATAVIAPYQVLDSDDEVSGTAVRAVECIMTLLKRPYEITVFPWVRAQKLVENGKFDAFFVASENENRNQYAKLSEPLFDSSWIWFYPKVSTIDPSSDEFMRNASVGAVFGTNMHAWLKSNFEHVVTKKNADELFQLLSVERLDVVLLTLPMFKDSIKRMGLEENNFRSVVAKKRPLGVYFGDEFLEKNAVFLTLFNQSIEYCKS
jgi:ABC-type amino acid transport substrate-binding protein